MLIRERDKGLGSPPDLLSLIYGAPSRIRTYDPQIRSLMLYPAELWAHFDFNGYRLSPAVRRGTLPGIRRKSKAFADHPPGNGRALYPLWKICQQDSSFCRELSATRKRAGLVAQSVPNGGANNLLANQHGCHRHCREGGCLFYRRIPYIP
jgi:hypothetical protein